MTIVTYGKQQSFSFLTFEKNISAQSLLIFDAKRYLR